MREEKDDLNKVRGLAGTLMVFSLMVLSCTLSGEMLSRDQDQTRTMIDINFPPLDETMMVPRNRNHSIYGAYLLHNRISFENEVASHWITNCTSTAWEETFRHFSSEIVLYIGRLLNTDLSSYSLSNSLIQKQVRNLNEGLRTWVIDLAYEGFRKIYEINPYVISHRLMLQSRSSNLSLILSCEIPRLKWAAADFEQDAHIFRLGRLFTSMEDKKNAVAHELLHYLNIENLSTISHNSLRDQTHLPYDLVFACSEMASRFKTRMSSTAYQRSCFTCARARIHKWRGLVMVAPTHPTIEEREWVSWGDNESLDLESKTLKDDEVWEDHRELILRSCL